MEHGEVEEGKSPFSRLALAGIIPETPASSQDCGREREEVMEETNMENTVASSTIVISPDTILDSSPNSHARSEDTVQCVPIASEEIAQPTHLGSELARPEAMGDYLSLETRLIDSIPPLIASSGCLEGDLLVDNIIIGDSGGEEEVEVKQELLEETEPQVRPCIQILDSLGIKRPTTARRIRK